MSCDSEERSYCGVLWKKLLAFLSDFNVGCAPKPGCLLETALPNAYCSPLLFFTLRGSELILMTERVFEELKAME